MHKLNHYFEIKWLSLAVVFAGLVILLTHLPPEFMPSQLQTSGLDKLLHGVAYGTISFLFVLSVKRLFSLRSALLILLILLALGLVDEITQPLMNRIFDFADLLADMIGIVTILSLSILGKHPLHKIKTEPVSQLSYTAAVAFITGVLVVPVISISLSLLTRPNLFQRQEAAKYFFYSTMFELFDDTYDPKEGSVSKEALETFKEYQPQLPDKCMMVICNDPYNRSRQWAGYFAGSAIFPTGDHFSVVILRIGERFVLKEFKPWDWNLLWAEILDDTERYYRLGYSTVY